MNPREQAREMRKKGAVIRVIAEQLKKHPNTIRLWTKDIILTREQKSQIYRDRSNKRLATIKKKNDSAYNVKEFPEKPRKKTYGFKEKHLVYELHGRFNMEIEEIAKDTKFPIEKIKEWLEEKQKKLEAAQKNTINFWELVGQTEIGD